MLYIYKSFIFYTFIISNIIKIQAQFICYKLIFVNLELRHKLLKNLIKLLVKKKNSGT